MMFSSLTSSPRSLLFVLLALGAESVSANGLFSCKNSSKDDNDDDNNNDDDSCFDDFNHLSTGAKAAIIGGIVAAILAIIFLWQIRKRKRAARDAAMNADGPPSYSFGGQQQQQQQTGYGPGAGAQDEAPAYQAGAYGNAYGPRAGHKYAPSDVSSAEMGNGGYDEKAAQSTESFGSQQTGGYGPAYGQQQQGQMQQTGGYGAGYGRGYGAGYQGSYNVQPPQQAAGQYGQQRPLYNPQGPPSQYEGQ